MTGEASAAGSRTEPSVRGLFRAALLAVALAAAAPAVAARSAAPQEPPPYAERLKKLSEELRCLVCQNQTLAESNADLALDLRREIEAMMAQGKSDAQIKEFLVQRYGDFVLYRPPVKASTAVLWFGPLLLLLVGAIAWLVVQRRSRTRAAAAAPAATEAERERARRLLDEQP